MQVESRDRPTKERAEPGIEADAARQRSDDRFRSLVKRSPVAMGLVGREGEINFLNDRFTQLFGYAQEDIPTIADWWRRAYPEEDYRCQVVENWTKALDKAASDTGVIGPTEFKVSAKDGTVRVVEISGIVFGGSIFACFNDLTDRLRVEDELRGNEREFRAMFEMASIGMAQAEAQTGRWLRVNQRMCDITGYTMAEMLQKRVSEITHPEERARDWEMFQSLVHGEIPEYRLEKRYLRKDGAMAWVNVNMTVIRDTAGQAVRTMATIEDITEKKRLEAQYWRAQRMENISCLANGIAHDLNNVLAPLLMCAPLLRGLCTDEPTKSLIDDIEKSAERGANIIRQLLTFGRGTTEVRGPLNPKHLLKEMAKIIEETFPKSIGLKTVIARTNLTVVGDPAQLHQVLLNLTVNAREAMPNGGVLTLSLDTVELDQCFTQMNPDAQAGTYVAIGVRDTGRGIAPEIQAKLFEPFFTTKAPEKGAGLGLATCQKIVRNHGGFLRLQSGPGRGTEFMVYLPATVDDPLEGAPETPDILLPGNGETILVVDDEATICHTAQRILEQNGYHVVTANSGTEAVVTFARHPERIRAALIDVIMPIMNGAVTSQALGLMNPDLPIILSSGAVSGEIEVMLAVVPADRILAKPYTAHQLLRMVRHVLDCA
jgi:two-component system, cell cycle sensor histidine kinase and response regulator CckA